MSDLIAKGGRGNKAPYETTLVRVPLPIKPMVEKITAQWRKFFEQGSDEVTEGAGEMLERVEAAIALSAVPRAERLCQEKAMQESAVPEAIGQSPVPKAIATPQEKPVNKIDYEAVRDRYLASLRLGKQAPEYKRAKQHIDAFIKELEKAEV